MFYYEYKVSAGSDKVSAISKQIVYLGCFL